MKKGCRWLLIAALCFGLQGCAAPKEEFTDIGQLPYENLKYNDAVFTLESVSLYQSKWEQSYDPFAFVTFDVSNLSEKERYWLEQENGLNVSCHFTSENNKITFEKIRDGVVYEAGDKIVYLFTGFSTIYKYDASDLAVNVSVHVKQDDNSEKEYDCDINESYSKLKIAVKDSSELTELEKETLKKGEKF